MGKGTALSARSMEPRFHAPSYLCPPDKEKETLEVLRYAQNGRGVIGTLLRQCYRNSPV